MILYSSVFSLLLDTLMPIGGGIAKVRKGDVNPYPFNLGPQCPHPGSTTCRSGGGGQGGPLARPHLQFRSSGHRAGGPICLDADGVEVTAAAAPSRSRAGTSVAEPIDLLSDSEDDPGMPSSLLHSSNNRGMQKR